MTDSKRLSAAPANAAVEIRRDPSQAPSGLPLPSIKVYHTGLTKREWLAGLAMQASISANAPFRDFGELALMSVGAADALLRQLAK